MASLKDRARRFVKAAFRELRSRVAYYTSELSPLPKWRPLDSSTFILRAVEVTPLEACLERELPLRPPLVQADRLRDQLSKDTRTGPLLGHMVGSPSSSRRLDAELLSGALLWRVAEAGNTFEFTEDSFSRGYEEWLSRTIIKTSMTTILAPLFPLKFAGRIELQPDIEIDQLDDEEVSVCLMLGAIHANRGTTGTALVPHRVAVRVAHSLPRTACDEWPPEERRAASKSELDALQKVEEVVVALRLFKRGRVAKRGSVTIRERDVVGGGPSGLVTPFGPELELNDSEACSFPEFWKDLRTGRKNKAIDTAVRRFSYAGERTRSEDAIVDLVVALEALVLDQAARTELKYRSSLRGALLITEADLTPRQVQKQLHRAYDVRSAVAHGGSPSPKHLKSPDNEAIPQDEFVAGIEELVRLALRKAVDAIAAGASWPPDWDALILEGKRYP